MQPQVDYLQIRNSLATGDVVLFEGKGRISNVIKWVGGTRWSHVGLVYRMHGDERVMLCESTTLSNIRDVLTGERHEGVQIVPLSQRIVKYDGGVAIRRLRGVRPLEALEAFDGWARSIHARPYERSTWELIKAQYDGFLLSPNEEDFSSLFCSELVGEALQVLGFAEGTTPANEFVPKDFSEDDDARGPVLCAGYSWAPQVGLK